MTSKQKLAADRVHAQILLDGTQFIPAPTCRRCGAWALVKDGYLEINEPGRSGTAMVPEITICLKTPSCGHVAVRKVRGLGNYNWRYGRANVEIVDGESFIKKQLPQPITTKQRERLRAFLAETATA